MHYSKSASAIGLSACLRGVALFATFSVLLDGGHRFSLAASPNPPDLMTYQGVLVDANGVPLGNTSPQNYSAVFRIYDESKGGSLLWSEQQVFTVNKGLFSVVLGEGTAYNTEPTNSLSSVFTADPRYFGISGTPAR